MPTVRARRLIPAPREAVWAVVSDLASAPRWNRAWRRVEVVGEAGVGAVLRAEAEDGQTGEFEVAAWEPPERIVFVPRRGGPEEGSSWLLLEAQGLRLLERAEGATLVVMEARARIRGLRGLVAGWLLWPGYQRQGLEAALERLAALFPGGAP
ncbi:hypothetical protein HRbin25_00651 [bacterium HR25]|nr:hypothetical protein HRbin25_00651 [bacterium HR25]